MAPFSTPLSPNQWSPIRCSSPDASKLKLERIDWTEAVQIVCTELSDKGRSRTYVENMRRVMGDLQVIAGLDDLGAVTLDTVAKWRSERLRGGWERDGRPVRAVVGGTINTELGVMSAFFERAVRKRWVARNVLRDAKDERVKVKSTRAEYIPDEDLRAILAVADPWMKAIILVAYYTAARRSDLLRLEWDRDVDLDGTIAAREGRIGAHVYIRGQKADTPHWIPLHSIAVAALKQLCQQPRISPHVFDLPGVNTRQWVSTRVARLCVKAGLTVPATRNKRLALKNKWHLHDLRRKVNTDLRNAGALPKERAALLGHRTTAINELHYEVVQPERQRKLIDGLPSFGMTA